MSIFDKVFTFLPKSPNKYGEFWAYIVYAPDIEKAKRLYTNCDGEMSPGDADIKGGNSLDSSWDFKYAVYSSRSVLAFKKID